jgi:hypothetical protein
MSLSSNFPTIRPSLLLDFANVGRLDPRVTFTRATTATYYDGVTTAKAEENLLLQSQALTTSPWTTTSLSAVGSKTAPDGTATAIEITATATNGRTRQTVTVVSGQTYTHSMFVRRVTGSGNVTLAILDSGGTALFSTVMSLTSDWQRFTVSGAPAVTSIQAGIIIATSTDAVEVWGAQLEQRSSVTAYTATTTQAITNYIPVLLTAQNDVPRFDHTPTTGAALGLLIEEQRTNLLLQSEDFSTTWAATGATVTTNATTAPSGSATADKLVAGSGITVSPSAVSAFVRQNITKAATATTYTFSLFAKAGEFNAVRLFARDDATSANNAAVTALLTDGTVLTAAAAAGTFTNASVVITNVGNGWYRVALTFTTSTETALRLIYAVGDSSSTTGDASKGIFIWGAQLEVGAFATSYIPTTTTALTRNADVASMTGTNFSSWYSASEGTMFGEAFVHTAPNNGNIPCILSFDDGTANNRIQIYRANNSGNPHLGFVVVSGGSVSTIRTTASTQSQPGKIAGAYKVDDFAASGNGSTPSTDTTGTVPTVTQAQIGNGTGSGIVNLNGWIARLAYYPTRLPNATLVALTS